MRWTAFLVCLSFLGAAHDARGAIEALVEVRPTQPPQGGAQSITYPGRTLVNVTLQGGDAKRDHNLRVALVDANEKTVAESRRWTSTGRRAWFELFPSAASAPGSWRLVIEADGERIAERALVAQKVPAPTVTRAVVTASISRNREPRRPLEVLGIPSAAYYYLEVSGFMRGRAYKVHHAFIDGSGKIVDERDGHNTGSGQREVFWLPVVARATDAPGTWTLRLDIDEQPVALTTIAAERGASKSSAAYLERWWPAVAAAIVAMIAYVVYHLATMPAAGPSSAPAARASLFDPSLVVMVLANLLPLAAVLYTGSDPIHVLFVYLCETFILAGFTILRILTVQDDSGLRLIAVIIFVLVFGLVSVSWGLGIFYFLADRSDLFELDPQKRWGLEAVAHPAFDLWNRIALPVDIVYMLAALFVSNSLSFVHDYLKTGAYLATTQKIEVLRPINRLALMFVAFWIMTAATRSTKGSPLVMLGVLVAVKLLADVHAYLHAHGQRAPIEGPS